MNDDSEVLQQKLLQFLQELVPDVSSRDVEALKQQLGSPLGDRLGTNPSVHDLNLADPHSQQEASSLTSTHQGLETFPDERETLFQSGEIPAVQDRFYSLLKQRLQTEIQHNPPLFPWETEIHDYETDLVSAGAVGSTTQQRLSGLWIQQLQNLQLPMPVPETVLAQLLQKCQDVARSTLLEGAKMVRAVEDLFPGQDQSLNYLAGLVMTAPARSPVASTETAYPDNYEAAAPPKQMILSLLAAREILTSLNLTLSPNQTMVERQWLVDGGTLNLTATYEPDPTATYLRIQGNLPAGGSLSLKGEGLQATADRPTAGIVSVELFDPKPNQVYSLEVRLTEVDPTPLVFTVRIVAG